MAQLVKNPPAMRETWVRSLGFEEPLEKGPTLPTPVFWSGECHGLYSPWGPKESDTAERLSLKALEDFNYIFLHCETGVMRLKNSCYSPPRPQHGRF